MTTTQTKPRGIVCKEPQVHALYGEESWERNDWVWVFDLTTAP